MSHRKMDNSMGRNFGRSVCIMRPLYVHQVTLYGSEGQTYSIYNNFGIHDWNIFRELYVAGYESKKFRTEAPFYQETIMIDEEYWSFIVTAPPTGEYGVNIWDTSIDQGFSDEFVSTLIEQAPIITALKTITEKYGTGMTPKIFCAGNILKNSSGYYWTFLTDYTYSYERCLRIGYANAKHVNSKKYKLIKGMLDINNASANDAVDHKQTAINIVDQFFNSISESK